MSLSDSSYVDIMTNHKDAHTLFMSVVELSAEERDRYLEQHCQDSELLAEVKTLLEFYDEVGGMTPPVVTETVTAMPVWREELRDFEIVRELGKGGMGVVYLARETVLDRLVAVKILPPHAASEWAQARFRNEAKAIARLDHPNIVPIYRFGEHEGVYYIAMAFVESITLAERIVEARGTCHDKTATSSDIRKWHRTFATLLAKVADALEHAHQHKIVHRDVKPANILVDIDGEPHLTDFGLAKNLRDNNITHPGTLAGTPKYMSPEQARAETTEIDHRSDIFSLGVTLYEGITFQPPFKGRSNAHILNEILAKHPRRLRAVVPKALKDLETICHKALEKQKQRRYQTAGHLSADLRCFAAGRPILAQPPGVARRLVEWLRQNHLKVMAASIVLLITIVGWFIHDAANKRRDALCSLSITSEPTNTQVLAQRFDLTTLDLGPPVSLGAAPIDQYLLKPGQYRISITTGNDRFAELNVYLPRAGVSTEYHVALDARNEEFFANMVFVLASESMVGRKGGENIEEPRVVRLASYWIDKYEVSNEDYKAFIDATNHPTPEHWRRFGFDPELAQMPIVAITWEDAQSYARWAGKRLPTAHEWEYASRHPDNRLLPWGRGKPDDWQDATAESIAKAQSADWELGYSAYVNNMKQVNEDPRPGALQLLHTFGNALEMTESIIYMQGPRVIAKGGSWVDVPGIRDLSRSATRSIRGKSLITGFRCAVSHDCCQP